MTHLIGRGRYRGEAYPATGGERGGGGVGSALLGIGVESIDPNSGNLTVGDADLPGGYTSLPRDGDNTPMRVLLTGASAGQVIRVAHSVSFQQGQNINEAGVNPVLTYDGGATWYFILGAGSGVWAGGGDITPTLPSTQMMVEHPGGFCALPQDGDYEIRLASVGLATFLINAPGQARPNTGMSVELFDSSIFFQSNFSGLELLT